VWIEYNMSVQKLGRLNNCAKEVPLNFGLSCYSFQSLKKERIIMTKTKEEILKEAGWSDNRMLTRYRSMRAAEKSQDKPSK